jgi:hypothetical protein
MNRYDPGLKTIGASIESSQLKVENSVPLRTIMNFDLLPFSRDLSTALATVIYPEGLIKLD